METARESLQKELNIVEILRQIRYFKLACHQLLPKETRKQLKSKSRYVTIDPNNKICSNDINNHELYDSKTDIQI